MGEGLKRAREAARATRIILDRHAGFDALPGTMTDSIVAGSCRRNRDGTLSIRCQISVTDSATGEQWMLDDRLIRLPRRPTPPPPAGTEGE